MADRLGWVPSKGVPWLQPGGSGYPIKASTGSTTISGPSGGGQDVESRYARSERGGPGAYDYVGSVVTGNPSRITFDFMQRIEECNFLDRLDCPVNVLVTQGCGRREALLDYTIALLYVDARPTEKSYSENLVDGTDNANADVMRTVNYSAGFELPIKKVRLLDSSGTVSDFDINKVISVGYRKCVDGCSPEQTGEEEFWAVTDRDNTPGYLAQPTPRFLYTTDGGTSWSASDINTMPNGDALDLVQFGNYVLVASPQHGVSYASLADIKAGLTGIWRSASGFSAGAYPRALAVIGGVIYAAGSSGYIWKSTDGTSFSTLSAGSITSQQINSIAAAGCDTVFFGGNSGALVFLTGGALSSLTVRDSTNAIVTSNLNVVAVPPLRANEVYVGTAGGRIFASRDSGTTWREVAIDGSGTGSITDLQFIQEFGAVLYIVQTGVNGKSRVLRDLTGGAGGLTQVELVSSYNGTPNSGFNSLAIANANVAVVVGQIDGGFGFVGKIS